MVTAVQAIPIFIPVMAQPESTNIIWKLLEVGGPPVALSIVFAWILYKRDKFNKEAAEAQANATKEAAKDAAEAFREAFREQRESNSEDIARLAKAIDSIVVSCESCRTASASQASEIATVVREGQIEINASLREFVKGLTEVVTLLKYRNGKDQKGN